MKAITAFLTLGIFVFLSFDASAQRQIRQVNKSEVQSKEAPKQASQTLSERPQTQETTQSTAPSNYQTQPAAQPSAPAQTQPARFQEAEPLQASPSSTPNGGIKLNKQQTKAIQQSKSNSKK